MPVLNEAAHLREREYIRRSFAENLNAVYSDGACMVPDFGFHGEAESMSFCTSLPMPGSTGLPGQLRGVTYEVGKGGDNIATPTAGFTPDVQTRISVFLSAAKNANALFLGMFELLPVAAGPEYQFLHAQFFRELEHLTLLARVTRWTRRPSTYTHALRLAAWLALLFAGYGVQRGMCAAGLPYDCDAAAAGDVFDTLCGLAWGGGAPAFRRTTEPEVAAPIALRDLPTPFLAWAADPGVGFLGGGGLYAEDGTLRVARTCGTGARAEIHAADETAGRRAYQHAGRFDASHRALLDARLDGSASGQFRYSLNKDGSLSKRGGDALATAEFAALLQQVETNLRRLGAAIFAGEVAVSPVRLSASDHACARCDYRAICRFDPWTQPFRKLAKAGVEEETE